MSVVPALTSGGGRRRMKAMNDPWDLASPVEIAKGPWGTGSTFYETQQSIWSRTDEVPAIHSAAPSSVFEDQDTSAPSSRRLTHRRSICKLPSADTNRNNTALPLSGVVLTVRYDARTDDRRRSSLGWSPSAVLDQLGLFDALDALELVSVFNRTLRRLTMNAPLLTPCARAVVARLNRARSLLLPADFSTLRSIDRLAVLKDDPKLPVPIFRELDQFLSSHPQVIVSLAQGFFSMPTYCVTRDAHRNGSLDRIVRSLSNNPSCSSYPPQSFLARLFGHMQPELKSALPLTIPSSHSGVILDVPLTRVSDGDLFRDDEVSTTQTYCLLAPQHLEALLKSVQTNHMETVELRSGKPDQAFLLAAPTRPAEVDDVRLLSCLVDLLAAKPAAAAAPQNDYSEDRLSFEGSLTPSHQSAWDDRVPSCYGLRGTGGESTHVAGDTRSQTSTVANEFKPAVSPPLFLFPAKSLGQL